MRKVLLAAVSALSLLASCSGNDDDNNPSWFIDKNLTKADIADHYYQNSKINIHITESGETMQVWRRDNSGGLGQISFKIDGDSIRLTSYGVTFRAHLVRYGEFKPLSLVLSGDLKGKYLPGDLKDGIYDQVK